jgi:hypothetical protein
MIIFRWYHLFFQLSFFRLLSFSLRYFSFSMISGDKDSSAFAWLANQGGIEPLAFLFF